MKHTVKALLALLVAIGFLTACGTNDGEQTKKKETAEVNQNESGYPLSLNDALDNKVTLEEQPKHIVSLIPSNTEILFELGLNNEIVGVSDFDNFPKEAADKEKIGGMEFNVEKIVGLDPDLVLAHESTAKSAEEGLNQLKDAGVNVFIVQDAKSFEEVYNTIQDIGTLVGKKEQADSVVSEMKSDLKSIQEKASEVTEKKRVYVEVSPSPDIYSTGKNTFIDQMLSMVNAENVMSEQEGWVQVNQEAVISSNPDSIITTYGYYSENPKEQIMGRKGWEDVTAVKNGDVHDVHSDLVTRTGPRLVEGVEEIAKSIYPEVFAE
ncbi:iron complex transport system substrate-binding protein [Bacillus sp. V-88]|jgi:iron complex transport system substrate-binding protein|uniref:ABC transporter substrate-binding protein n=1 Tax=Rossellomorea vietnamensis TaxID=218284 RepID=UPI000551EEC2|nr:ABC transporter substrate-binding protein [Rossellomorea vietnamensis]OXS62074.1 ABC transporter substrate-binding protein [Bacillus sp. DSM 27956]PRX77368.1 iron complex transport system substrate-binding protein [Bacillus sp. V-88]SLK19936.1 iron complex transport system substrate-binding protein [Bacillus sp. V-88]